MKNLFALVVFASVIVLISGGCSQEPQMDSTQTVCLGPSLNAETLVTYQESQSGPYITVENHEMCFSQANIEISADEPQGNIRYRLDGSNFMVKSHNKPTGWHQLYAKLMLTTTRLGDYGWQFVSRSDETEKIFGETYKKVRISASGPFSEHYVPWAEITLYGNPQNNRVERVTIKCEKTGTKLTSYAYNWRFVKELGLSVPTKIDVLNTENGTANATPVLQANYLTLRVEQPQSPTEAK